MEDKHLYLCMLVYIYTHTYNYIYMYVCMYVRRYVCMYVYMYTHIISLPGSFAKCQGGHIPKDATVLGQVAKSCSASGIDSGLRVLV